MWAQWICAFTPTFSEVTISTLLNHLSGLRLRFSASLRIRAICPGPLLGEHGAEVLREQLGMNDAEIAELRSQGVLYSENK